MSYVSPQVLEARLREDRAADLAFYAALDAAADSTERRAVFAEAKKEEARRVRDRTPSLVKNTATTTLAAPPTPQPSRAAQAAEIHLSSINATRKRCGMPLLTMAELTNEYAELDREPAASKSASRWDLGNAIAARQGMPTSQAGVDALWAGAAAKLNATLPAHGVSPSGRSSEPDRSAARSTLQTQAEVDNMHAAIVARLNATLPAQWRP